MQYTPIFQEAARAGGDILRNYFGRNLVTVVKSSATDLSTQADADSEKAILDILRREYPSFNVLSEECGYIDNSSKYTLVIDPLDGTSNFMHGIPNFSILIALLCDKEIIAGLIHQPITHAMYYAEKGLGAFVDGVRISVNKNADLASAAIGYTSGYTVSGEEDAQVMLALGRELKTKRFHYNWCGAIDVAMLASGKLEVFINDGNKIYDFGPGKIIAREAGALITDINGRVETDDTNSIFIISNGTALHEYVRVCWKTIRGHEI